MKAAFHQESSLYLVLGDCIIQLGELLQKDIHLRKYHSLYTAQDQLNKYHLQR